ncbi:MAG: transcription antitermination factor NusB [Holosporaceae bacterium]|jgi:N utilization substance protein B|nr:transcription antitermination factor NusB [Holosporaceae bacterium]
MPKGKERKSKSGLRGVTRLYAVQELYRAEMENLPLERILEEALSKSEVYISENISLFEIDGDFFRSLLETAEKNLTALDAAIVRHLSANWKFDRMAPLMKSILRLGLAELLYFPQIPKNVVFNEYIEISKAFFLENEVAFVNGLLNSVISE